MGSGPWARAGGAVWSSLLGVGCDWCDFGQWM
jgi:hypothetical protein